MATQLLLMSSQELLPPPGSRADWSLPRTRPATRQRVVKTPARLGVQAISRN